MKSFTSGNSYAMSSTRHLSRQNNLKGKSICFTGKLNNFTRNRARAMAIAAGMTICESVTASLDYLVMADPNSTSTKACKARGYGVKLISEDDFLDMMELDKKQVEAETEYRKTHKPILDWKTCFNVIAKKLGITFSKKSSPVYWRGKDEKLVEINMWIGYSYHLGSSNDIIRRSSYGGRKLEWTDDDRYDMSEDDAYRKAVWLIGTKTFRDTRWTDVKGRDEAVKALEASYPEFGMPGSTEELKLKLEVLDWSIL